MIDRETIDRGSTRLAWLLAVYGLASLAHFAHNAEYLHNYPNLPLMAVVTVAVRQHR